MKVWCEFALYISTKLEVVMAMRYLRTYYVLMCFVGFLQTLCVVTYSLFLASVGFNRFEIAMVNMSYYITMVLFEIPLGLCADLFGRRIMLIIGQGFYCLGYFIYYNSMSFPGFISAEICLGLAFASITAPMNAWIYDTLKHYDSLDSYNDFFTWGFISTNAGRLFGGLTGAYLAGFSFRLPYISASIGHVILLIVVFCMVSEPYRSANGNGSSRKFGFYDKIFLKFAEMKAGWQVALRLIRESTMLRGLIVNQWIVMFFIQSMNLYWSLYFSVSFKTSVLGWIWAVMLVLMSFGCWLTRRSVTPTSAGYYLAGANVLIGVSLFGAVFLPIVSLSLTSYCLHQIGRGIFEPARMVIIHNSISDNTVRSTVESSVSVMGRFGCVLGLIVAGFMAKNISIAFAWTIAASVFLVLGLSYGLFIREYERAA